MSWALAQEIEDPTTKLLLIAIANFADENGKCWPSQKRLSRIVGNCSVDTIQRHCRKLENLGIIARHHRGNDGGGRSSDMYELNIGDISRSLRHIRYPVKPQKLAVGVKPHSSAVGRTIKDSNRQSNTDSPCNPPSDEEDDSNHAVRIKNGKLVLSEKFRSDWIARCGGDDRWFDLTLDQFEWQEHSRTPLESQVSKFLTRGLQWKYERDQRYEKSRQRSEAQREDDDPFAGRRDH